MPYLIAILDTETWDTNESTAALMELAVIVVDIETPDGYHNLRLKVQKPLRSMNAYFNLQEQVGEWGRTFSLDTFDFHVKNRGYAATMLAAERVIRIGEPGSAQASAHILLQLQGILKGIDELWINGVSFDAPIVKTLWRKVFRTNPKELWNFRTERDFRTIRKLHNLPKVNRQAAHQAYEDCVWLAEELSALVIPGNTLGEIEGYIRKKIAKEQPGLAAVIESIHARLSSRYSVDETAIRAIIRDCEYALPSLKPLGTQKFAVSDDPLTQLQVAAIIAQRDAESEGGEHD